MPDITTEEQQILDKAELKIREFNYKGSATAKLSKQETAILANLRTEFEASPGNSTEESIRASIEKSIQENPIKQSFFSKVADKALDVAQQNANIRVGNSNIRIPNIGSGQKNGPQLTSEELVKVATTVYAEAEAKNPVPKTIEDALKNAAKDSVLDAKELDTLVKNPKFAGLLNGKELSVVNVKGHDNDEVLVGGDKGKHINLSDLGLTINDGTAANGGFPVNTPANKKTVVSPGSGR